MYNTMTWLEISCLPGDLPEYIEVDSRNLELGSSIHMSEIVVPERLTILELAHGEDHDQVVVSVHAPRRVEEADEGVDVVADDATEEAASDVSDDEPAKDE